MSFRPNFQSQIIGERVVSGEWRDTRWFLLYQEKRLTAAAAAKRYNVKHSELEVDCLELILFLTDNTRAHDIIRDTSTRGESAIGFIRL